MKKGELYYVNEVHRELEREDLLKIIKQELKKNPHIISVFYSDLIEGSSELDLHLNLVVQPAFYKETLQHKRAIASTFGKVLFFEEDMKQQNTIIVHYESLVKVFVTFHDLKGIQPSIDYKKIIIVDDPYGIMTYVSEESKNLQYTLSFEDLDSWRTKFFSNYYEFYRSVYVDESYKARHCLNVMRWLVATMWMIQEGNKPNVYLDWSHMEGSESILKLEQQNKLKKWGFSASIKELEEVLKSIVDEFYQLHEEFCRKLHLAEEQDYVYRILSRVKQFGSIQPGV